MSEIEEISGERYDTDKKMSILWLIILIIITFIPIPVLNPSTPQGVVNLFVLLILFDALFIALLIYNLVKRRDAHFHRQWRLFLNVFEFLSAVSKEKDVDLRESLTMCNTVLALGESEEIEREAGKWAILSIVPIINFFVILYVFYFLMNDFYRHESREDRIIECVNDALEKLGGERIKARTDPILYRNFVLYLFLTFITFGIFIFYWVYVLIKDPNKHFDYQDYYEYKLVNELKKIYHKQ